MRNLLLAFVFAFASVIAPQASAAVTNFYSILYASSNVSSASYTTIVASSPLYVTKLYLCDTSYTTSNGAVGVKLAMGSSGHEIDMFSMPYGGCAVVPVNPILAQGTRLSLKAITNVSATAGFATVSFLP